MTTDITELAQSLKAAAIDAKELAIIARYSKGRAAAEKFYALANPNNVIALVEALELKEEQRANWSLMAQKLGEDLDAAEKRIAELESRAVKLPKKNIGWDRDEEDCWNNAIDACAEVLAAAGIKVEAE
ncbi:hypothetical protein JZM00_19205 [Escherichia coli]|uniref:ead/Ea22-like family protein n=1 Tax=Escherichia coli TaxID=562 RepID=UPI000E108D10|nr:ead/Ea22-like family protein [Escherichia coli]AXH86768.1 hypothetical protein DVH14_18000 [Escherichia coli]MBN6220072.1 hypothetical protein [Escherichia coli]MBN6229221.1 hypothetical protein [Escherichia coli]HCS6490267.1 hypothetical protein [Escherichia coli]